MEHFDILDDSGRPTGRIKPREAVHRDGDWHRTVHVWVVNHAGDILLQKRSAAKESHPGKWDISAAGHIEAGSTSIDAAVRELHEEIDIKASPQELRFLFTVRGEYHESVSGFIDREFSDVYLYRTLLAAGDMTVQKDEVECVRFAALNELQRMVAGQDASLVPHDEELCRLFAILVANPPVFG